MLYEDDDSVKKKKSVYVIYSYIYYLRVGKVGAVSLLNSLLAITEGDVEDLKSIDDLADNEPSTFLLQESEFCI